MEPPSHRYVPHVDEADHPDNPTGTSSAIDREQDSMTAIELGDDRPRGASGNPVKGNHGNDLPTYDQANEEENPPEYESILGKIRKERRESSSIHEFLLKVCKILCVAFGVLLVAALMFSLSIACIVIGAKKLEADCVEERLASFLIVWGVSGIVGNLLTLCQKDKFKVKRPGEQEPEEEAPKSPTQKCIQLLSSIIQLFSLAWLIYGSVLVYRMDPGEDFENCDQLLYSFTYWTITAGYIAAAVIVFLTCCCGGLVACLALGKSS